MTKRRSRILNAAARLAVALGASALGALALPPPALAQQDDVARLPAGWQANEDDFLFLQLVIENYKLTYDVRGYQTDRGVCLDLADVIQSLDLPVRIDKKSRRATGWLFSEDQTFTLDREQNTVQNVNTGRAPVARDIYDTPEGWCVDTAALSRWFGIDFRPDLYNAVVRLKTDRELPFIKAIERRSRAARLRAKPKQFDLTKFPNAEMEYRPWRTPSLDVVAQAGYRTGNAIGGRDGGSGRLELYAAGEALGASYTARIATDDQLSPQTVRLRAYRNDPDGNLLGPLKATQVAAGDVETVAGRLTGQTAIGRGAFVSNRPLGQTSRFDTTTLRGTLPAGWDAELYRNGQLIGFQDDRGDGRYEFIDVELFYGRNDLEVVLYGPQGQIRRETSSVPVGFNQIEPGQTYYWAGVVQNQRDLFDLGNGIERAPQKWRWGVGVERGLDQRTSAAIGVQNLFFAGARRTYAEGSVARSFGRMQLELVGAHEFGAGSVAELNAAGRFGRLNFGANTLISFGNFTSEFVTQDLDYRAGFTVDTSLALGRFGLPIQAEAVHSKLKDESEVNEFLLTTSVNAGRAAFSAQLDHRERSASPTARASADTRLRLLANARFKGLRVRGNAAFLLNGRQKGFDNATVRVDKDIDDVSDLQAEVEYTARQDEFRFAAGYTRRFDKFSLRSDAYVTSSGGIGANIQLAFSLGPDPVGGGVRVTHSKLARSGQAAVTVFRDDDGNGVRDPGEELLKDVLVEAGLRRTDAITGENGRAIVDDLRPFRPVLVGVDESSLGDPFLAPAVKGIVLTPRPGVVAQIELPVSPTGEVEGMLLNPAGVEQPGVALELVDLRGNLVATTISEFDGFFLLQKVPYGEYRLRVAEAAANTLSVASDLTSARPGGTLTVNRANDIVRLGPIKLRRNDPPERNRAGETTIAAAPVGPASGDPLADDTPLP
ncbi:collagen binding domain-containing protein [Erythrobacter sp. JK5]|uniref:MSCRAMM family protein n=1 Tax=Erythrobacter sp. JK5 TaxID=2829500 RepID=UPI001BAB2268|nr:carboxypeptidase-like regulatory domain-containing protein [Erythrobacter sp. JK5]QUL37288.1 carboxypeptidase regulatory-like domain-containing protein [Erythrobacter sp. JK5]